MQMKFEYVPIKRFGYDTAMHTKSKNAETYDVEFNEWADQELMSHGKDISFKDWAEDEGMKHGNTEITDWAQHEDESHDARYGAETFDFIHCSNCLFSKTGLNRCEVCNTEFVCRSQHGEDCNCYLFTAEFESLGYSYDDPPDDEDPMPEYYETYLEDEEWKDMGLTEPESFEDYSTRIKKEYDGMDDYFSRMEKDYERFGLHLPQESREEYIERVLEEGQMNAERKKRSDLLSEPFWGTSLDSGDWKGILTGFGIGLLGLFGYSKLRK